MSHWPNLSKFGYQLFTTEFFKMPIDGLTVMLSLRLEYGIPTADDAVLVRSSYQRIFHHLCCYSSNFVKLFLNISMDRYIYTIYIGIAPAVLRQATYGTIKFGLYYTLKKQLSKNNEEHLGTNVFCAVTAGVVSSAMANPTDVLKVRLQGGHQDFRNMGLMDAFLSIYRNEGIQGLWRGVCPTAQRAGVIVGVELPIYDMCKHYFIRMNILPDNATNHFLSSFISSLGGAIASTPLDVIRVSL
ncbi:unnamed protein product [Meganyctiphanes norvegica]|uniref:Uncharacterized protein n=1 Tax=Meganyctiphanes norvegica TaxID=48144 RepID=A0AAV2QHE5_MEGNR